MKIVSFHEKADVYVINTCTVTNIADRKSRQMLHRARKTQSGRRDCSGGMLCPGPGGGGTKIEGIDILIGKQPEEESHRTAP